MGVGVSVEVRDDVGLTVRLTGETSVGVMLAPGVAGVFVGRRVCKLTGVVVDDEDGVGVESVAFPAMATTLSRSRRASSYFDDAMRTLALSYSVAGFSSLKPMATLYAFSASVYTFCLINSRPFSQLSISSVKLITIVGVTVRVGEVKASAIAFKIGPVLSVPSTSASVTYSPLITTTRSWSSLVYSLKRANCSSLDRP